LFNCIVFFVYFYRLRERSAKFVRISPFLA